MTFGRQVATEQFNDIIHFGNRPNIRIVFDSDIPERAHYKAIEKR